MWDEPGIAGAGGSGDEEVCVKSDRRARMSSRQGTGVGQRVVDSASIVKRAPDLGERLCCFACSIGSIVCIDFIDFSNSETLWLFQGGECYLGA